MQRIPPSCKRNSVHNVLTITLIKTCFPFLWLSSLGKRTECERRIVDRLEIMGHETLADLKQQDLRMGPITNQRINSYGTYGCGYETMAEAWSNLSHDWSIGGYGKPSPKEQRYQDPVPKGWLDRHPVDLIVADQGSVLNQDVHHRTTRDRWESLVAEAQPCKRPKVVLESWPGTSLTWERGPANKARTTRWRDLGYETRYRLFRADKCGGAIKQLRFVVARVSLSISHLWEWNTPDEQLSRPMSNMLIPWGLLPKRVRYGIKKERPPHNAPDSTTEPMPPCEGCWIKCPEGTRRLQKEEVAQGLGCNKEFDPGPTGYLHRHLMQTTSVHIWECISPSLLMGQVPRLAPADLRSSAHGTQETRHPSLLPRSLGTLLT